jgi:hypothetical protein
VAGTAQEVKVTHVKRPAQLCAWLNSLAPTGRVHTCEVVREYESGCYNYYVRFTGRRQ